MHSSGKYRECTFLTKKSDSKRLDGEMGERRGKHPEAGPKEGKERKCSLGFLNVDLLQKITQQSFVLSNMEVRRTIEGSVIL